MQNVKKYKNKNKNNIKKLEHTFETLGWLNPIQYIENYII